MRTLDLSNARIVISDDAGAERYLAGLLCDRLQKEGNLAGVTLVSPKEARAGDILLGDVSGITPDKGKYRVDMNDCVRIVSDSIYGYLDAADYLLGKLEHQSVTAAFTYSADISYVVPRQEGELRVMYHNVLGYNLQKTNNQVSDRANMMLAIYQSYQPDILCLEEMTTEFRKDTNAAKLMEWLSECYIEICHDDTVDNLFHPLENGGTPTPLFYRKDSGLTLVESGYIRAREKATKGTTWAVFRKGDEIFCVTNSHFVSPTERTEKYPDEMKVLRTDDANAWLNVLKTLRQKYGDLPVLSGGDWNSMPSYAEGTGYATPYQMFANMGYQDVRTLVKNPPVYAAHHAWTTYDGEKFVPILMLNKRPEQAFDHMMLLDTKGRVTFFRYENIDHLLALTSSDHAPHYADFSFSSCSS